MKNEVIAMLERQAAWQRQRADLPWSEKLQRAVKLRGIKPPSSPPPRPRGRPMSRGTALRRLRRGEFSDAVLRACRIHVWCNAGGALGDIDQRWGWRCDEDAQLGFASRDAACQAAATRLLSAAGSEAVSHLISLRLDGELRDLARAAGTSINDGVRTALRRDAAVRETLAGPLPPAEMVAEIRGLYRL